MEFVGSLINTSRPGIDQIIEDRNKEALLALCSKQIRYGADRIALNCGTRIATEAEDMVWMTKTIRSDSDVPLMVDSPNPEAIEAVLRHAGEGSVLIDSTTCEQKRIEAIMPLTEKYRASVTVLLYDEAGMPETVEDRLRVMPKVVEIRKTYGMRKECLLLDALVFPLSICADNAEIYLESVRQIRQTYPGYAFTCGMNNISYGLPGESVIDVVFLQKLAAAGQECVFLNIDPLAGQVIRILKAMTGEDEYTMNYLSAYQEGWFPNVS